MPPRHTVCLTVGRCKDENIRYIHRYISDISNIGDVRHDIADIADISVLDRYIMEISCLWHTRALI